MKVHYVLLHLNKKHPPANFFRIINDRPVASSLIESSAKDQDRELLKDMYYQDDRRADGALVILRESLEQEVNSPRSRYLDSIYLTLVHLGHCRQNGKNKARYKGARRSQGARLRSKSTFPSPF